MRAIGGSATGANCTGETMVVTKRGVERVLCKSGPAQNSSAFCVCLFLTVIYKPSKPTAHSRLPQMDAGRAAPQPCVSSLSLRGARSETSGSGMKFLHLV